MAGKELLLNPMSALLLFRPVDMCWPARLLTQQSLFIGEPDEFKGFIEFLYNPLLLIAYKNWFLNKIWVEVFEINF
jgi:hypothetical protein